MSLFVTIEGIEGAGKSTLRASLSDRVRDLGVEVVVTREPGATALGQAVRSLVLDPRQSSLTPLTELMLFAADRAQHLAEVIRPALDRGAVVLCDRYIHSTIAYQGYGRGLPLDELRHLNQFVTSKLSPDLVLLLDLSADEGLERAAQRTRRASGPIDVKALRDASAGDDWNRFEEQNRAFHDRVRNGFLEMSRDSTEKMIVLDATVSQEILADRAFAAVQAALAAQSGRPQ